MQAIDGLPISLGHGRCTWPVPQKATRDQYQGVRKAKPQIQHLGRMVEGSRVRRSLDHKDEEQQTEARAVERDENPDARRFWPPRVVLGTPIGRHLAPCTSPASRSMRGIAFRM